MSKVIDIFRVGVSGGMRDGAGLKEERKAGDGEQQRYSRFDEGNFRQGMFVRLDGLFHMKAWRLVVRVTIGHILGVTHKTSIV